MEMHAYLRFYIEIRDYAYVEGILLLVYSPNCQQDMIITSDIGHSYNNISEFVTTRNAMPQHTLIPGQ